MQWWLGGNCRSLHLHSSSRLLSWIIMIVMTPSSSAIHSKPVSSPKVETSLLCFHNQCSDLPCSQHGLQPCTMYSVHVKADMTLCILKAKTTIFMVKAKALLLAQGKSILSHIYSKSIPVNVENFEGIFVLRLSSFEVVMW